MTEGRKRSRFAAKLRHVEPDTVHRTPDPALTEMAGTAALAHGLRAWLGAALAPVALIGIWLWPLPLEPRAHRLAAIFAAVIVLWVSEALPVAMTALLIAPAMVLVGVTDATTAFAPYADPLLFLFVGGFMIAQAMTRHGLDRRLALGLVNLPVIAGRPARVRIAFITAGMLLSMWISNTATTAILMPILLGLLDKDDESGQRSAISGDLLTVAYTCSIGGIATPVGSPPNLITMRFLADAGHELTFLDWSMMALPIAVVLAALAYVALTLLHPPGHKVLAPTRNLPPPDRWSSGERTTALAFFLAVAGWMLPGVLKALKTAMAPSVAHALPAGGVALFAAAVLFLVPDRRTGNRVLPWSDAARIDWGIVMLFGGGISLGRQMFDTGLASAISRAFVQLSGVDDLWPLTAIVVIFTIIFTEACSNTATSNMLAPLVIGITRELRISPVPPVIGMGLAASCAFMLPIATGPNAIAYASGKVGMVTMIRSGFVLNVACAAAIFAMLRLLCPLYGWS